MSEATIKRNNIFSFKIGMIAPTGAGKTSLLTAICEEVQERLLNYPFGLEFNPKGTKTKEAMDRARAEFNTHVNRTDDLFSVFQLKQTSDCLEYEYAVSIPPSETGDEALEIDFSILDYPGRMLVKESEFDEKVEPHVSESVALLVPVSADILIFWNETKDLNDTHNKQLNNAANKMLEVDSIHQRIKEWLAKKVSNKQKAQLFFVPVKCEKYFKDNGGVFDASDELHKVVYDRFIKPLELNEEERNTVQINIFDVDTYGVVELRNIADKKDDNGELTLVPTFRRRTNLEKKLRPLNAYELLMSILKFQMEVKLHDEKEKSVSNEEQLTSATDENKRRTEQIEILKKEIAIRKAGYWFFQKLLIKVLGDRRIKDLEDQIRELKSHRDATEVDKKVIEGRQQGYNRNIDRYENAIRQLTGIIKTLDKRQEHI